jgi:hypothetical protein
MRNRALLPLLTVLAVIACQKTPVEKTTDTGATIVTEAPAPMQTPPLTATQAAAVPPPAGAVLASQDTNTGAVAEITEFRRKGNTLTAKVRFVNRGSADSKQDISWSEAYLLDANAGKKYEVLKDEKGSYIATLVQGWGSKWWDTIEPGQTRTIWMKFPAPPAEVKTITLQIPGAAPFEDVAIQD